MGYQESWVYIEPQWNFKNLIRAYEQAEAAGYYKLFGAEPLKLQVIPIEAVLDMNDSRLDGIHFENSTPSENPYMKRYSVVDYVHRMKQAQSKYHSER